MSEKATYSQESEFSLVAYPAVFKFLLAPFLDLFYSNSFGKNKTYIVPSGILMSAILFFYSTKIEAWVENKNIGDITSLLFFQSVLLMIYQIACEAWVFTLFDDEDKSKASVARVGGGLLGMLISYNLFLPMNSLEFLNKYIYGHDPLKKPLLTHYALLMFIALFNMLLVVYIWIFVKEKKITRNADMSLRKLCTYSRKLFFGKYWLRFMLYIFLSETALVLIRDSIQLRLIQYGIERAELATMESITVVLRFGFCLCTYLLIADHKNLKRYHFTKIYDMATFVYFFCILKNYMVTNERKRAMDEIFVFYILRIFSVLKDVLVFAFLNDKIDEEMGATSITVMLCITNAVNVIPKTIGYKIIGSIEDYNAFANTCFILSVIGYAFTWPMAVELDSYEVEK